MKQACAIEGWHPTWNPNGTNNRGHWATLRRRHRVDADMAWASALQAGWQYIEGKVRLTVVYVYPRNYRVDSDNLTARLKGVLDGLRTTHHTGGFPRAEARVSRKGFFADDSTAVLELHVRSEVQPGRKALLLELEAAG